MFKASKDQKINGVKGTQDSESQSKEKMGDGVENDDRKNKNNEDDQIAVISAYYRNFKHNQQHISRLWKTVAILVAALIIAIIWIGVLGNASKVDLAVIHTNGNNQILSVNRASQLDRATAYPELNTYFLEKFVLSARRLTVDGVLQNSMMQEAMSFTQGQATKALVEFYQKRKPEELMKTRFIEVKINNVLSNLSDKTTQIQWTEVTRDNATNQVVSSKSYTGQFTFSLTLVPPKSERIMMYNPLGFYIQHISWTRDYTKDQNV